MNPQMTPEQALKVVNDAFSLPNFTLNRADFRTVETAMAQLEATVEKVAALEAEIVQLKKPVVQGTSPE